MLVHAGQADSLTLRFKAPHWLYIEGDHLPGKSIEVNYLEAYCRAGSTDADWGKHTVIPHTAELLSLSSDKKVLKLRDTLEDGVVVAQEVRINGQAPDDAPEGYSIGAMTTWPARKDGSTP